MSVREAMAVAVALLAVALGGPATADGLPEQPATASGTDAGGQEPKAAGEPSPAKAPAGHGGSRPTAADSGFLAYTEPDLPDSAGLGTVVARVVGSLAVVIGLIVLTALALRRYLGGTKAPTTSRKVSELVEVTPLGGKRYLYLIRVADRLLVVGSGGDHLTLLSEITDPEVLEHVAALPRRSDFLALLHRVRAGVENGSKAPDRAAAS